MYVNYYHVDISGVPGVGKTASTMEIVSQIRNRVNGKKCVFGYFNAMNLTTPT
jgi:Cdc6-like AAA superfamily ATPase